MRQLIGSFFVHLCRWQPPRWKNLEATLLEIEVRRFDAPMTISEPNMFLFVFISTKVAISGMTGQRQDLRELFEIDIPVVSEAKREGKKNIYFYTYQALVPN